MREDGLDNARGPRTASLALRRKAMVPASLGRESEPAPEGGPRTSGSDGRRPIFHCP